MVGTPERILDMVPLDAQECEKVPFSQRQRVSIFASLQRMDKASCIHEARLQASSEKSEDGLNQEGRDSAKPFFQNLGRSPSWPDTCGYPSNFTSGTCFSFTAVTRSWSE
jgi:hypothetical protein